MYTYGGCSNFLYLQTAILRESKIYFRESFANPTFIFGGGLMLKSFAKSFAKRKVTLANSEKKLSWALMLKPQRP
jgi:hypothetical protein